MQLIIGIKRAVLTIFMSCVVYAIQLTDTALALPTFSDFERRRVLRLVRISHGSDLRTRSIVTVSMLDALGHMHELEIHVRSALNNGVTEEELQEIFLHASVYCGFPAAVDAFRTAAKVIDAA